MVTANAGLLWGAQLNDYQSLDLFSAEVPHRAEARRFREAVDNLMKGATIGYAVRRFNSVYAITSVELAGREDQFRSNPAACVDDRWRRVLVDTWMTRNDMQNFVLLGDPAVRAKIATLAD